MHLRVAMNVTGSAGPSRPPILFRQDVAMSAAIRSCISLVAGLRGCHSLRALRTSVVRLGIVAFFGLAAATALPTASGGGLSGSEVVFDSITGNTPTGSVSASGSTWQAAQFILPTSVYDFRLRSVVLNFANNPLGTSFQVDIYDAKRTGSEPNNKVGPTLLPPTTVVVGNNTFTPDGSFPLLSPTEEYFVVVKGVSSAVSWSTAGPTGVITPASQTSNYTAVRVGGDWVPSNASANPYMMTVNAVPVPEPSTWAMGLAGLGFAGVTALRRRLAILRNLCLAGPLPLDKSHQRPDNPV